MSTIGHNSGKSEDKGISAQRLKSFMERIERLETEKTAIGADIKEVYSEAKSGGFDTAIMRKVIAIRRMDTNKRAEQQALMEVYMNALGMLADTPLGQAAISKVA
jgi:uncharacterized protein (UPF0335 family)